MKRLVIVFATLLGLIACGQGLKTFDDVNDPSDDAKLAHCRAEGREAGPDARAVFSEYFDCTKEAGLR